MSTGSLGLDTYTVEIECLLPENRFSQELTGHWLQGWCEGTGERQAAAVVLQAENKEKNGKANSC